MLHLRRDTGLMPVVHAGADNVGGDVCACSPHFCSSSCARCDFGSILRGNVSTVVVERNSTYKSAGYCFKTPRAIARFGNAGCLHDSEGDVPLSAAQRRLIGSIVADERAQGCGD